ncbi:MAG TPA: TlpA disulfide reductase family protein [Taishania sp.]|nr:TlpA disulfide reductase family protein [Taishania sp.]
MMRYLVVSLICLFALVACNSNDDKFDENGKEINLEITGNIKSANGQLVKLEAVSQGGVFSVVESKVEGESFKLRTNVPGLGIYQLRIGDNPDNAIVIPANIGDHIQLDGDISNLALGVKISGVDWGKTYTEYMKLVSEFSEAQGELMELQNKVSRDELVQRYFEMKKPVDDYAREKINQNPGSPFNLVMVNSLMPTTGLEGYPKENLDAIKKMAESYAKKYSNSPITQSLAEQASQIESGLKEYEMLKAGIKPAPEIELESPEGKVIKLSSLKGKVVLVDFWASWCKPCRMENPNVVKLYNKYKNKGFTVYSVSLDDVKSNWVSAIEQDGLIWPNHVSDLMGWKSYITKLYGVSSIPHTVLVGKDGNIIAVGLRGEQLALKLEEILK